MSYNLLNYPGTNSSIRNPYFSTVISNTSPDILVVQEITSQAGVTGFLNNILLPIDATYSSGTFIDGPDTDNAVFFKSSVFNFISNTPISTALRDINEFKLVHNSTNDTIRIYSVHLKASSGSDNELLRLAEVTILRNITDALPPYSDFIVCGDFNIYGSTEPAYQKLLNQSTQGYFIDLFNLPGTWNQSQYAQYHTQSPRTRQFGGGANGGMDDRFDMILMSQATFEAGDISYVPGTYIAYGNDGLHYNDSINRPPNIAVGQIIADAIHYASDHIPVFASFNFDQPIPVDINVLSATVIENDVQLNWETVSEINNYGFNIERSVISSEARFLDWLTLGFVPGNGTTNEFHSYQYNDTDLSAGKYQYRLKQIDNNGQYKYSPTVEVVILPQQFALHQNYPNPFNPSTTISYDLPSSDYVTLKIYDVLGNLIDTIVEEDQQAGFHSKLYVANSTLSSGMYFYTLQTSNSISTNKMILIK
jgi:endonuclease/exonuclease/phosphatase family metal-dependent hydrolase